MCNTSNTWHDVDPMNVLELHNERALRICRVQSTVSKLACLKLNLKSQKKKN